MHAQAGTGVELVFGEVRHARLRPVRHAFAYPAFHACVPLDALLGRSRPGALLGINRAAPLSVHAADHGDGHTPLDAWLSGLLADCGLRADGHIELHCFTRVLGHTFKPVSFWHCHDAAGALRAVVAEVNNTFGERHCYVLGHRDGSPLRAGETLVALKRFHVSPFFDVSGHYRFRFMRQGARSVARVELHDDTGPLLVTSLSGTHRAATPRACARALLGHPLFTLGVVARIHWHALRLLARRVAFRKKPTPPGQAATPGLT